MRNDDIDEIIPHLFISNWNTSNNSNIISTNNIKSVITLETSEKPKEILDYYRNHNIDFTYIKIPDSPNENIGKYFDLTFDLIENKISKGENVLVHCFAGVSRSSTIVLNYLIKKFYMTNSNSKLKDPVNILNKTLEFSKTKRSVINPNQGFLNQLLRKTIQYSNEYFRTEYFCMRKH